MTLTKIGSIGINTGIQFAGVTTIATLNASDNVLSVGGTVNFVSDVSIGGTVSIAGTLTYEDVTNVDAVGIITARSDLSIADKIIHTGDTNTAIRFPANDTITAETAGSEAIRVTSGQKFLIGSTSMRDIGGSATQSVFQIEGVNQNRGSISLITNQANGSPPSLRFGKTRGSSVGAVDAVQDGDNLGQIRFVGSDGTDLENTTAMIQGKVNGTVSENTIPTDLAFETSATNNSSRAERLRITSAGRVVVGSTTGDQLLSVVSGDFGTPRIGITNPDNAENFNISSYHDANGIYVMLGANSKYDSNGNFATDTTAHRASAITIDARNSGSIQFHTTEAGSNASERLRITSSGQVLIGATAADASNKMIVQDSGTTILKVNNTDDGLAQLTLANTGSSNGQIKVQDGTMAFDIGGTEHARIANNGKVGIATSNPVYGKLTVGGSVMMNGSFFDTKAGNQTLDKTIHIATRAIVMILFSFSLGTTTSDVSRNIYSFGYMITKSNGATWTAIDQDLNSSHVGNFTISNAGSSGKLRIQKSAGSDNRLCSFRIDILSSCNVNAIIYDT